MKRELRKVRLKSLGSKRKAVRGSQVRVHIADVPLPLEHRHESPRPAKRLNVGDEFTMNDIRYRVISVGAGPFVGTDEKLVIDGLFSFIGVEIA